MKKVIILSIIFLVFVLLGAFLQTYNRKETKKISGIEDQNYPILELAVMPNRNTDSPDPQILAKAVYLIDVDTAFPLFGKNENEKMPIASTTKIATALVVLENHSDKLNDIVTITAKMISVEGSDIQLRVGEKITVENLLNGLLIMSGNDTAFALAEYFGNKDKFVAEMNNKVAQIGLRDTAYFDPAGLDDRGYSTARDLAILGAYALRNQKFAEIVRTSEKTISSVDGRLIHKLTSSNHMLLNDDPYYFPLTIGIKTGFTYAAGHVLVSAAGKDGHKILAVILNTNEDTIFASAKESKKLLEWGFANWKW